MPTSDHRWLREQTGRRCVANLRKNGFDAHWLEDRPSAAELLNAMLLPFDSFGFGGSATLRELGVIEQLRRAAKKIADHWQPGITPEEDMATRRMQLTCDCFLCSANAIAASGEIVNVDGIGNRTSAMGFGPRQVIIVAGINKVAPDLAGALERVRRVAAPLRARSLKLATPCAETGICTDCHAPQRICRITTILHRRPMRTPVSVLLINDALGF